MIWRRRGGGPLAARLVVAVWLLLLADWAAHAHAQAQEGGTHAPTAAAVGAGGAKAVVVSDVLAQALAAARQKPVRVEREQQVIIELKPKATELRAALLRAVARAVTPAERRDALYRHLSEVTAQKRAPLVRLLEDANVPYTALWLTNACVRSRPQCAGVQGMLAG
jgi:hypothetical protein